MIARSPTTDNPYILSSIFLQQSRVDDAGGGYCAKGVANLLEHVGLGCQRGDAYTWKNSLPQNGWIKLEGIRPEDAPPGAVLVYDRSRNSEGKGGGTEFGHVEIATVDTNGRRQYVSDKARDNWGGTVPQNFVGVYVHPSLHQTTDGINYTPNLNPRPGAMFASSQSGSGSQDGQNRNRTPGENAGMDPFMLSLLNGQSNGTQDAAGDGAQTNNSDLFNGNANMSAFVVLAMMISALYGVQMDTGMNNQTPDPNTPVGGSGPGVRMGAQTGA